MTKSDSESKASKGAVAIPSSPIAYTKAERIGLVGCVKSKVLSPSKAKDLYISPLFRGRRRHVEQSCGRWLILSALHGLVDPEVILEPYDFTPKDLPPSKRKEWSARVFRDLELKLGELGRFTFEIHAGSAYRDHGLVESLRRCGAQVDVVGEGLTQGQLLRFYAERSDQRRPFTTEAVNRARAYLTNEYNAEGVSTFPSRGQKVELPGLYSWWCDPAGLDQLSQALDSPLERSLIYLGQAGAGTQADLAQRILLTHIGGKISRSTFRLTLASLLKERLSLQLVAPETLAVESETLLGHWIREHLSVAVYPYADRASLRQFEEKVISQIDTPLNLAKVDSSPLRQRLSELRWGIRSGK